MMNLERKLTLSTCLMVLAVILVPILGASIETQSESPTDRVKRRSFYNPYSVTANRRNSVSIYEASSIFKPSPYAVSRPYYIPVYGTQGRGRLIFYPPQPISVDTEKPQNTPQISSDGGLAGNLGDQSLRNKENGITITSKIKDIEKDDVMVQDYPKALIWGTSEGDVVQMTLTGDEGRSSSIIPTRAPSTAQPTQPSLARDAQSLNQSSSGFTAQQQAVTSPSSPTTIQTTTISPSSSFGPSNCIWAIISCCSASNPSMQHQNCFEQRGCPGPFWGMSPCESTFAQTAIEAVQDYFNQK